MVSRSPRATLPSTRSTPESQSRQAPTSVSSAQTSAGLASIRVTASKLLTDRKSAPPGGSRPYVEGRVSRATGAAGPRDRGRPRRRRPGRAPTPRARRRRSRAAATARTARCSPPRGPAGWPPPAVAPGGVGEPDGELGQPAPEPALRRGRALPGVLEDLV